MALSFMQRKPDSGLGNIHASPSAPGRNIDYVLLFAQGALAVIGLFVIYSASHTKSPADDPYDCSSSPARRSSSSPRCWRWSW